MNVLLINTEPEQLRSELVNFFLSHEEIQYVVIINSMNDKKITSSIDLEFDLVNKIHSLLVNFQIVDELNKIISRLFETFGTFSKIIYVERIPEFIPESFHGFIADFSFFLLSALQKKINFFQIFIKRIIDMSLTVKILVLIPHIAQTKFIDSNIGQSILFSSFHALTTAIADEFIDNNIICNALVQDSHYLETMSWLLFDQENNYHGKLFQNKKIIDW